MAQPAWASSDSRLTRFVRSNFTPAFFYPVKGIWYFATHKFLHPLMKANLVPLTLLSTCILAILFLTLYLPVVAFLALFHYKGSAWVNATFFILGLGVLVAQLIFEALFVDKTQVDVFDAVLVAEGREDLVKARRTVSDNAEGLDPLQRLGSRERGATFAPFSLRQIIELLLLLPLNFVPFFGVPLFLILTGYRAGPLLSWRHFQLRQLTKKERRRFIAQRGRTLEYMWFGTTHMILELVPVLSMAFLLTTAAGSALWAIRVEEHEQMQLTLAPGEEDAIEREDYYDDEP